MARNPKGKLSQREAMGGGKMAGDSNAIERNAYIDAPKIAPGCQHMLGCKCDTPFWLRDPTRREVKFEEIYIRTGFYLDD